MPEDLRQKIIEAIAASGDENYKRLLMLLLRVEEVFLERVAELTEQMTVPAQEHAEDHAYIKTVRSVGGGVKSRAVRIFDSVLDKGAWVVVGLVAAKFFH